VQIIIISRQYKLTYFRPGDRSIALELNQIFPDNFILTDLSQFQSTSWRLNPY